MASTPQLAATTLDDLDFDMTLMIKNLDTGAAMTIEEFERAAEVSQEPHPIQEVPAEQVKASHTKRASWLPGAKKLGKGLQKGMRLARTAIADLKEKGSPKAAQQTLKQRFDVSSHTGDGNEEADAGSEQASSSAFLDAPEAVPDAALKIVKVMNHRRATKDVTEVEVVQILRGHEGVVWAMAFSQDGQYLATAGQDCLVRVWELTGREDDTDNALQDNASSGLPSTSAPSAASVFVTVPVREYQGHTEDVLDLVWSKSRFLLSASIDKSVRLWHMTSDECLRVFWHHDFVTSVCWHPTDANRFVTGSIDGKVRVWSVSDTRVAAVAALQQDMVTAVTFSSDGKRVIAGSIRGKCRFYEHTETKLDYIAQVDVRNQRGPKASGKKVTGVLTLPGQPDSVLITSNDSRIRLFQGYIQECKYKGNRNSTTQIRASLSANGDRIICGSDDGYVFLWETRAAAKDSTAGGSNTATKNNSFDAFQAYANSPTTVALFAPPACHQRYRTLLSADLQGPHARVEVAKKTVPGKGGSQKVLELGTGQGQLIVASGFTGEIKLFEACK